MEQVMTQSPNREWREGGAVLDTWLMKPGGRWMEMETMEVETWAELRRQRPGVIPED